ncbi:hypothetical protein GUJ93_ZPchr0006g45660 [Zizania palustris]|uniref:Large ribosomal subunit protein uL30 N-terminal eukaryotes domain-containing protein n=1 Tax=Zizania palustris TaxID=103762 RepID=A0A8J5SHT7_ZIZPA|nr:hypothetical protein GUJ93_ZPchr0006g45660 [Zizania palustris]
MAERDRGARRSEEAPRKQLATKARRSWCSLSVRPEVVVPESMLRERKREELWAAAGKEKAVAEKKKAIESRKIIFSRAKQYAEEYEAQEMELEQQSG